MAAQPKILITHSEEFHTDDVFATALLVELFPDATVIRTRDEAVIATGTIVYDVGKVFDPKRGRFDHHQEQAGRRENGIIYSSFGLLWQEYGLQFCGGDADVWKAIDTRLVEPIDAHDNGQKITDELYEGVEPFTIDDVISAMNPQVWVNDTETHDAQFMQAVELAKVILHRVAVAEQNKLRSRNYLLDLYASTEDKRILVTDRKADVSGIILACPGLLYVVSPRPSGNWGILAVSIEPGSFVCRRPFPEAWRAQPAERLVELTGVQDVTFCHASGFYAVTESKQGAVALAKRALDE